MMRALFLFLFLGWLGFSAEPPNVILLIGEGVGVNDIGCYGGVGETPHIDAVASNGVRFVNVWGAVGQDSDESEMKYGRYQFRATAPATAPSLDTVVRASTHQALRVSELVAGSVEKPFCCIERIAAEPDTSTVQRLDELVGRLRQMPNTLILIAGFPSEASAKDNAEAMIPLIVQGPTVVKPGRVSWDLIDATDFVPTLAAILNVSLAEDATIDGHSFLTSLLDHDDPFEKRNWIFHGGADGGWMIRDWHHILDSEGGFRRILPDRRGTAPVAKNDKIAPHRKQRLEMLAKRLLESR